MAAIIGGLGGASRQQVDARGTPMPASTFRKKPVEIQAMRWTGDNIDELWDWAGADNIYGPVEDDPSAYILTLEGRMEAKPGDWIIRGVRGEFYPCKPDIFEATYDQVGDGEPRL